MQRPLATSALALALSCCALLSPGCGRRRDQPSPEAAAQAGASAAVASPQPSGAPAPSGPGAAPPPASSGTAQGPEADAFLAPLVGVWVSSAYVAVLKAKHSPRAAQGEGKRHVQLTVGRGQQGWELHGDLGLHEALEMPILSVDTQGKSFEVMAPTFADQGPPAVRNTVKVETPRRLLYDAHRFVPVTSVAPGVANFDEAISSLSLGGVYQGDDGKDYVFGGGGKARWGDRSAQYQVVYDYSGTSASLDPRFDLVTVSKGDDPARKELFAFRRLDAGKIALHRLPGGFDKPVPKISGRPDVLLSLHK